MKKLFRDRRDTAARGAVDRVVPLHEAAVHFPVAALKREARGEERELLADAAVILLADVKLKLGQKRQHALLYSADVLARSVQNMQAMPPGELALDRKDGVAVLVVDIVAVEPGKKALLE